ncbi:MAG TPA: hypothetical protein PLL09_04630 [Flavobacterium sp.]|uniref:hypothetical protein n=1 Tax=unclassified Flavobacterium TaxID=196869 RepID=UPI0025B9F23B|nr:MULTISPECIES: hypothetical protein [unclassified Flavobacterium]HRE77094.1 hypothetical protein [Flavobacterium sp.]
MTKLNKNFDNIEDLLQREFDTSETIKLLIHTNTSIYMSWGVEQKINFKNKGLLMKVNGHHHKGWLLIVLAWNDTYSYYLLEGNKTIKKEQHEVYFDQLQELIDLDIEKLDDYKF